jgi:starch-binding outer membrane protein, SusD/RagB family
MKILNKIVLACVALCTMNACSNVLNVKDESSINSDVWNNESSANLYLNSLYGNGLPAFGTGSGISDETNDMSNLLTGNLEAGTAASYLANGSLMSFSTTNYNVIRYINIAFGEMESSTLGTDVKEKIDGQLSFLRAWEHWKMTLLYGGVPYMTSTVDPFSSDSAALNTVRNKTSECIEYIKSDLNLAIADLPATWSGEYTRPTRATAAALLGRIMLFYASPEFTDPSDDNYKVRWDSAYAVNKRALALADDDGYGLLDCSTSSNSDITSYTKYNFNYIFSNQNKNNKEIIWARPYADDIFTNTFENSTRPTDETVSGSSTPSNCPSWDLVKAFPMSDGQDISTSTDYDSVHFYKNRDPRFYSDVVFNGSLYTFPDNTSRIQWTYSDKSGKYADGASYHSETGFYCRKMIDQTLSKSNTAKGYTDWVEIRYAEVLLNCAECAAEKYMLGEGDNYQSEALEYLGKIRARAGILEGSSYYGLKTGNFSLIERVMNERRIELCFENKRFWDLRRRNMFANDLGDNVKKLNGWKKAGSCLELTTPKAVVAQITALYGTKGLDYLYTNYFQGEETELGPAAKSIAFPQPSKSELLSGTRSYNFFDIPTDALNRCTAVAQTLGWPSGSFNPFE